MQSRRSACAEPKEGILDVKSLLYNQEYSLESCSNRGSLDSKLSWFRHSITLLAAVVTTWQLISAISDTVSEKEQCVVNTWG